MGKDRIEETIDPELAIDRALETETGKSAITSQNAVELNKVVVDLIEEVTEEKE